MLTAIAVPRIPPAKLLVPNKPNTVILCWSENQLVRVLTQFGHAVDCQDVKMSLFLKLDTLSVYHRNEEIKRYLSIKRGLIVAAC